MMLRAIGGVGGLALVGPFGFSGGPGITVKTQRGNIAFDQIRLTDRQGTGSEFQMYNPVIAPATGDVCIFDGDYNLVDAGAPPALLVAAPSHHNSSGFAGQQATDSGGAVYFCYATNAWVRINSGGWSNSF